MSEYEKLVYEISELRKSKTDDNRLKVLLKRLTKIDEAKSRYHRPIGNYKSSYQI